jgi:hypothetical protein
MVVGTACAPTNENYLSCLSQRERENENRQLRRKIRAAELVPNTIAIRGLRTLVQPRVAADTLYGSGGLYMSLIYQSESFEPPPVSTARGPPGGRWYVGAVHGEPELAHAVAAIDAALTKLF